MWVLGCSGDDSVDCSISLPRRVYIPWHRGVSVCDYLLVHETLEVNPTVLVLILVFAQFGSPTYLYERERYLKHAENAYIDVCMDFLFVRYNRRM